MLVFAANGGGTAIAKDTMVVLPLRSGDLPKGKLAVLNDLLINKLDALGPHRVVALADVTAALGEQRARDLRGCNQLACATEIGGALDARYLAYGSVTRLGKKLTLSFGLIDTKAKKATRRATAEAPLEGGHYGWLADVVVRKLFKVMPIPELPPPRRGGGGTKPSQGSDSRLAASDRAEGLRLLRQRNDGAARKALRQCNSGKSGLADCDRLLGIAFEKANDRTRARRAYERFIALGSNSPHIDELRRKLSAWALKKHGGEALRSFDRAELLARQHHWPEALHEATRCSGMKPKIRDCDMIRGQALMHLGNEAKAYTLLKAYLKVDVDPWNSSWIDPFILKYEREHGGAKP